MIDLHSHILPGLDDGVATLEESVELARRSVESGVQVIVATPHVREDYPTSVEAMNEALSEVRARIESEGVPIRVLPGGEIGFEQLDLRPREELRAFGLGGNPEYLLVETPYFGLPIDLEDRLVALRGMGITPVLAHPERNPTFRDRPDLAERIVAAGAIIQITAGSLAGALGRDTRKAAFALLDAGLAHCVASDSHGAGFARSGLDLVMTAVGDGALVEWLTYEVPAAIIGGGPFPPRPARPRSRLRMFRFR